MTSHAAEQSTIEIQMQYEQRFACPVCMEGKLHMIYSLCQHRVCADCLYDDSWKRKPAMSVCPICTLPGAFPFIRPDIPEDTIFLQQQIGVRECPYQNCGYQTWEWEMKDHISHCPLAPLNLETSTGCLVSAEDQQIKGNTRQKEQQDRSSEDRRRNKRRNIEPKPEIRRKSQRIRFRTVFFSMDS